MTHLRDATELHKFTAERGVVLVQAKCSGSEYMIQHAINVSPDGQEVAVRHERSLTVSDSKIGYTISGAGSLLPLAEHQLPTVTVVRPKLEHPLCDRVDLTHAHVRHA